MCWKNKMAGQSPLRGCSTVWSEAKKNYELEWRSLPSTQESAWLCKLLFILTKTPLKQQLLCLPPLTGSFLSLDASLVRSRFQSPGAPYGADVLQRAGDVRTWRFQNIHNAAAKNGIISKGLLQQKRGRMLFWSLRPFLVTASGYDRWQETGAAN